MFAINYENCTGCGACVQRCPKQCISWTTKEFDFRYPQVDEATCINCGLCEKVCPMTNPTKVQHEEGTAWVAQNLNNEDLKTSSSGGGFIAIAKYVLSQGGVVYGAAYQDGPIVAHERIDDIAKLERLKGSKYVQSDTRDAYSNVKIDLKEGRMVYFVGTPCQVAGLKLFLRKDYDNLHLILKSLMFYFKNIRWTL